MPNRRLRHAATAASLLSLAWNIPQARAQAADHAVVISPAPPPTQAIDAPQVERLFGPWDAPGSSLWDNGINLQFDAATEFAGNVSGGTKQGATFASQVGISADINWERLANITGLSTHIILVNRSGSSDSHLFGDNLLPVQEIYGSGGDAAIHLVSVYAQETLYQGRLDVAAGRMNVENDFASSPLYCNFVNNGLCGDPKALPGGDRGHSAFPDAVWAARVKIRPAPTVYVTIGAYEVNQGLYGDQDYRSGFEFHTARDSGAYIPAELGWEPTFGADKLPGHYKLGLGYDTSGGYPDFVNDLAADGVPGYTAHDHHGHLQVWALADQMLFRNGPGDSDGITGLAGYIHNDPTRSVYADQYFAGLVNRDFWAARPQDAIGLLLLYNTISGHLANVQAVEEDLALPLSNGATGIQTHEIVLEANYDIHMLRGVNVEPDFQYIIRPNAQTNIPNAAVLGVKAHVEF